MTHLNASSSAFRYNQCDETCTVDCGHCKGAGRPGRDVLVVEFIRGYRRARGFSPSLREIGDALGLRSTSTVAYLIDQLATSGVLRHTPNAPRSLVVAEDMS